MDLNRLYFLHQVALMQAAQARDSAERRRLYAEADGIASRIAEYQGRNGALGAPLLPADAF